MRALSIVVMLAACGRIGFTPRDDAGAGSWWDPSWTYRKKLVIDHGKIAGDLVDFPVLVVLDDPDIAMHAQPGGTDLAFVDANGTELAFELEHTEIVGVQGGTTVIAWIEVPAVSATTDTVLYVYYGNPAATSRANAPAVWSNGFTGVYHFGDGVTFDAHDSTTVNDGVNNGALTSPNGKIFGAVHFPGGPNIQATATGVDTSPGGLNTVSFWMSYASGPGKALVAFSSGGLGYDLWLEADNCFGFNTENGDVVGTAMPGLAARWVYVAAVFYNGVPDTTHNALYIDGTPQTLTTCAGTTSNARTAGGSLYWASNNGYQFTGLLDEGQIARGARSAAWIRTAFTDQNDPATFAVPGIEESAP